MSYGVIAADGSFHLTRVSPGLYAVRLSWGPYVKSMRLGETEIRGDVVDLRNFSGGAALTVTAGSPDARISGVVRGADGPVAGARVALLPEVITRFEGFRSVSARPDGTYSFTNVAPGKYTLLVLDADASRGMAIGNLLGDYADIIVPVEIHPGDRVTQELRQHAKDAK